MRRPPGSHARPGGKPPAVGCSRQRRWSAQTCCPCGPPEPDGGQAQAAQLACAVLQQRRLERAVQMPREKLLGWRALGRAGKRGVAERPWVRGVVRVDMWAPTPVLPSSTNVGGARDVEGGSTGNPAHAPTSSVLFSGSSCSIVSHACVAAAPGTTLFNQQQEARLVKASLRAMQCSAATCRQIPGCMRICAASSPSAPPSSWLLQFSAAA